MLAALRITGPLASQYPGSQHSLSPLGRPWNYEPPLGYTNDFQDEQRRRRRKRESREQKTESPWSGAGQQPAGEAQQSMFNSPRKADHSSNVSPGVPANNVAPVRGTADPNGLRPRASVSSAENVAPTTHALPPVAALTGTSDRGPAQPTSDSPTAWRSTGIHSILNPTSDTGSRSWQHGPGSSSDQRHTSLSQDVPTPAYASPLVRKRGESHSSGFEQDGEAASRSGRRILTPRSPGLRAASLSGHRSPSLPPGMSARAPSRHGDSRLYTAEPGERHDSTIPPMPSLAAPRGALPAIRSSAPSGGGFRSTIPAPSSGPGHEYTASTGQTPPSSTADTPQSAYRHTSVASPPFQQSQSSSSQIPRSAGGLDVPLGFGSMPVPVSRPGHNPSHGWKLALEGGDIGVEVDNQQASKMADEKRKRNAGASARFRARRKEKEKEASQTISGLQQELRDMADARDFYVSERNFYRDLWARSNAGAMPPRPASPQYRRVQPRQPTGHDSDISSDYGRQESLEVIPPQRRQTTEFQPTFVPGGQSNAAYNSPYPPPPGPPYSFQNGPAPPSSHPVPTTSTYHDTRPGPSSNPQLPPPRSGPPDPFRQDPFDRTWNPSK